MRVEGYQTCCSYSYAQKTCSFLKKWYFSLSNIHDYLVNSILSGLIYFIHNTYNNNNVIYVYLVVLFQLLRYTLLMVVIYIYGTIRIINTFPHF